MWRVARIISAIYVKHNNTRYSSDTWKKKKTCTLFLQPKINSRIRPFTYFAKDAIDTNAYQR